jgi:hypothetical protein
VSKTRPTEIQTIILKNKCKNLHEKEYVKECPWFPSKTGGFL